MENTINKDGMEIVTFAPHQQLPDGWLILQAPNKKDFYWENPEGVLSSYFYTDRWLAREHAIREMGIPEECSPIVQGDADMAESQPARWLISDCQDLLDVLIVLKCLDKRVIELGHLTVSEMLIDTIEMVGMTYLEAQEKHRLASRENKVER